MDDDGDYISFKIFLTVNFLPKTNCYDNYF